MLALSSIIAEPSFSQEPRPAPTRKPVAERASQEPVATFDTLLSADAYRVYGEVRSVGQFVRSAGVSDVIEPVLKLAGPPKELTAMVKWLNSQADALTTSRMLVAIWPLKPKLPQVLIAIEFSSAQEAQKFVPQLREFLPQVWPTPAPQTGEKPKPPAQKEETPAPAPPPFQIRRSGSIVLLSDSAVNLRNLRPTGSKLLAEEAHFRTARNRFSSESVFLYVAMAAEDTANPKVSGTSEELVVAVAPGIAKKEDPESAAGLPPPVDPPSEAPPEALQAPPPPPPPTDKQPEPTLDLRLGLLTNALVGGPPEWPEAVGLGLNFDDASYVVRVLLLNTLQTKRAVPFIPNLISGPALAPESAAIMPFDSELFVTASLDLPQIYEGMVGAFSPDLPPEVKARLVAPDNSESPFASFEKEFGINIQEELLPLFGNEVAMSMPLRPAASPTPAPTAQDQTGKTTVPAPPSGPNPVFAIAIKDREAVRALIAKMLDSAGLQGAQLLAQVDRRDDSELISFGNVFSYAFVGNFLVFSQDSAGTRHLVDSYRANKTLISDGSFKNYLRWQPRQVLGQVYIAPTMDTSSMTADLTGMMNEDFNELLSRLSPYKEPITYALSNEGMGPLHEIRFPKNFVIMYIAGMSAGLKDQPMLTNEATARSALEMIARFQATYRANKGDGQYATLEQLLSDGAVSRSMVQDFGYTITVNLSSNGFTAGAVPNEYGKTGKNSFFIDESGVLRGGDHGGGPATIADNPLN